MVKRKTIHEVFAITAGAVFLLGLCQPSVAQTMVWTDPEPLNNNAGTDSGDDNSWPQLATDGVGTWVAVWSSTENLPPGSDPIGTDYDILVAVSNDDGLNWTDPVPLNNHAAVDSGDDQRSHLTTDGAGNWVAVWRSTDSLGDSIGIDRDILIALSADNGLNWTDPAPLNNNAYTDSGSDQDTPRVTTDGAGNWVAVWSSTEDLDPPGSDPPIGTDSDILLALSTDNGLNWTDPMPLNNNAATDSGHDYNAHVATDGAGNWVAVWDSRDPLGLDLGTDYDILVSRSIDNGLNWTDPEPLNNNAALDADGVADDIVPKVTTDGIGNWVAVWHSEGLLGGTIGPDFDILVALSTDNGLTWTDPAPLNNNADTDSGHDEYPKLTTDGAGNWMVVWDSDDSFGGAYGTDFDILVARGQLVASPIPTVSEWGLIVMTLLVLTAGTLIYARRRPVHA